jgi:CBS domain-containing protein
MMTTVRQLLDEKGSNVWKIASDANVFDALRLMAEKNVGALLVLDKNKIVGIFSERDYARKVILKGKSSRDITVADIMTQRVVCVRPSHTIEEAMALMTEKHIRHLPVCEGEDLLGMISIGDIVKAMISDREFIIEQLENYITQGG